MTDQTPHHDSASDASASDDLSRDRRSRDEVASGARPALDRDAVAADRGDSGAVDAFDRADASGAPESSGGGALGVSSVPASAHANAARFGGVPAHDESGRGDAASTPGPARAAAGGAEGPHYGVGPFSVREVALLGVWVVAFLVSFFRTNILDSPSGVLVGGSNVWLSGLWWIPAVALPTVAVGLIVLRRLSPQGIRRVGSLGIDQFASVAFAVAALVWVSWVWDTVAVFGETGIWTRSWVIWVEAVVLLAGVVLTVFAPIIPPFSRDFRDRDEVPAHRNARPIRPVVARPRTPRTPRPARTPATTPVDDRALAHGTPVAPDADDAPTPGSYTGSTDLSHEDAAPRTSVLPTPHADRPHRDEAGDGGAAAPHGDDNDTDIFAPLRTSDDERDENRRDVSASAEPIRDEHPHAQAFWALAPEEREIVDDYGTPIFHIGPTAWALVVEDRGETFVVRHDDGRIGYLHDVSGVTRG
ncbi:hypothetical protein ACIPVB_08120 [Microbacterium sp. NPDC090007]|uniref:hypothetical protein n=1 Tax=Microbacterium sp. NPDC090007 TaxID=3364204 RepID=UPI003808DE09